MYILLWHDLKREWQGWKQMMHGWDSETTNSTRGVPQNLKSQFVFFLEGKQPYNIPKQVSCAGPSTKDSAGGSQIRMRFMGVINDQ